jgi:hypothetical protein
MSSERQRPGGGTGERPAHPHLPAALLMLGVATLLVLLAASSL